LKKVFLKEQKHAKNSDSPRHKQSSQKKERNKDAGRSNGRRRG
jgi:hypothetical protein